MKTTQRSCTKPTRLYLIQEDLLRDEFNFRPENMKRVYSLEEFKQLWHRPCRITHEWLGLVCCLKIENGLVVKQRIDSLQCVRVITVIEESSAPPSAFTLSKRLKAIKELQ